MLPLNPRAGRSRSVSRQPTMTQMRSASRPRERYEVDDDGGGRGRAQEGSHTRSVRSQRSMGNIRPSRNKELALPPPPPPTFPKLDHDSRSVRSSPSSYARPPPSRDSDSSASSLSSSGSSFLDRMRHRGTASSSSQSSFELDLDASKETGGAHDIRKLGLMRDEQMLATNDLASYGYSIWNRVATAASSWAWNGSSNNQISGVEPSSGDSELTRALKAYHISKARDRSDLPDWLFTERERRVDTEKVTRGSRRSEERVWSDDTEPVTRAPGRGLRDIYDSVATAPSTEKRQGRGGDSGRDMFGSGAPVRSTSKATDRLKAIRDAKRQAARPAQIERAREPVVRKAMSDFGSRNADGYDRRYEDSLSSRWGGREVLAEPVERNPPPRVGLPTNPRRR